MHYKLSDYSSGRPFNIAHCAYLSTHAVALYSDQNGYSNNGNQYPPYT
jgi:hypothetical protein